MLGAYWLFRSTDISLCAGICIYQIKDCQFVTGVSRTVRRHPSSRHNIPRVRQATTGANPQTPAQCQGNARHPCIDPLLAQQTRGLDLMLFQCWTSAVGGGPTMKQHWVISSCLLGGGGGEVDADGMTDCVSRRVHHTGRQRRLYKKARLD